MKLQLSWVLAVEDHACSQALLERLCKPAHYSVLQRQIINILNVIPISFSNLSCSRQTQAAVSFKSASLKPTFTTLRNYFWGWTDLYQRQKFLGCSSFLRIIVPMLPLGMGTTAWTLEEKTDISIKSINQMNSSCKLSFLLLYVQIWNKTNFMVRIFTSSTPERFSKVEFLFIKFRSPSPRTEAKPWSRNSQEIQKSNTQ